ETDAAEVGAAFRLLDRHDARLPNLRLEMPIFFWRLPERVNLRRTAFLDHEGEARGFRFEELHKRARENGVIPSEVEGSRGVTLKLTWRDPSTSLGMTKSPPEDYGKEDQTTVAAFLPWRGSLVLSP